jgi:hypothetical protein
MTLEVVRMGILVKMAATAEITAFWGLKFFRWSYFFK